VLDKDGDNKSKLMELFEQMQDYGEPPKGISSINIPGGFN
jgi:hypothetical protein